MRRRLARLNHILIPTSAAERERFRRSRAGRFFRRFEGLYYRATAEGQVLAGAAFFAGLTGLDVGSTDAHQLFSLATALLLGSFAASQRLTMKGVTVAVSCPARVTLGEELRFTVTLNNRGDEAISRAQVIGPFLTWDGAWVGAQPQPVSVAPGAVARVECRASFRQRGQHQLEAFRAARVAPLGLALGPTVAGEGCRFVVVPKVATVLSLRMPQPRAARSGGAPLSDRAGVSMDLLGTRPYRPGDRARDLHAPSWARTGSPVVREYAQEAVTAVGILLDPSGEDDEAYDGRLSLTAGILAFLLRSGAVPELIVASDRGRELALGSRFAALEHALELLACTDPEAPQSAASLAARVAKRETPWSRALLVCGALGPWQRSVADALSRVGIPCGTYVVADPARLAESPGDERSRVLSHLRVLSGEGLWL